MAYFWYSSFGETMITDIMSGTFDTPYRFNSKELDEETGLYYYGARYYNPSVSIWLSVDALRNHPSQVNKTPYAFSWNNPINMVDPDGNIPWPLFELFKGFGRKVDSGFQKPARPTHNGVDLNHTGGYSTDLGAPIRATHDGIVSRVASYTDGDPGGNRIQITSSDKKVRTYYMHLQETPDFKVGDKIKEGQVIGKMGRTGFGKTDAYDAHLHYEMSLGDGEGNFTRTDPVDANGNLKDPQKLIETDDNSDESTETSSSSRRSTRNTHHTSTNTTGVPPGWVLSNSTLTRIYYLFNSKSSVPTLTNYEMNQTYNFE